MLALRRDKSSWCPHKNWTVSERDLRGCPSLRLRSGQALAFVAKLQVRSAAPKGEIEIGIYGILRLRSGRSGALIRGLPRELKPLIVQKLDAALKRRSTVVLQGGECGGWWTIQALFGLSCSSEAFPQRLKPGVNGHFIAALKCCAAQKRKLQPSPKAQPLVFQKRKVQAFKRL